jgi:hypothetical protein
MSFFKWFYILLAAGGIAAAGGELEDATIVDPASYFTVDGATISWTALPMNVDAYIYKDYGANYFAGDLTHRFTFTINDWDNATILELWAVGRSSGTYGDRLNLFSGVRAYIFNGTFYAGLSYSTSAAVNSRAYVLGTQYFVTAAYDKNGGPSGTGQLVTTVRTESHEGATAFTITSNATAGMSFLRDNGFQYVLGPSGWGSGASNDFTGGSFSDLEFVQ